MVCVQVSGGLTSTWREAGLGRRQANMRARDVAGHWCVKQVHTCLCGCRYFRAFIWNRDQGGEAFEWTLAGLQRRAANMHAGLFRRHRRRRHV